jgi:hypothetical protein
LRKAKATIAEHGADQVALILQGKLDGNAVMEAGLVAQPKTPKAGTAPGIDQGPAVRGDAGRAPAGRVGTPTGASRSWSTGGGNSGWTASHYVQGRSGDRALGTDYRPRSLVVVDEVGLLRCSAGRKGPSRKGRALRE